jgi:hypothetical protein
MFACVQAQAKPAPAPGKAKAESPKPAAPKAEAQKPAVSTKRKGPLPLFAAQLLVLGAYAGVAVAFTKYYNNTMALLQEGAKKAESAATSLAAMFPK